MRRLVKGLFVLLLFLLPLTLPAAAADNPTNEVIPTVDLDKAEETIGQSEIFGSPIITRMEGVVDAILEERVEEIWGEKQKYQKIRVKITSGEQQGRLIEIESGTVLIASLPDYRAGERILLARSVYSNGEERFEIVDYKRYDKLFWLFLVFVLVAVSITRWQGITSIIAMGLSFFVIQWLIVPQIAKGGDPVLITTLGVILILPMTFYLSHGFNRKTTVAVIASVFILFLTALFSAFVIDWLQLSGFGSEDAGVLQAVSESVINIKGILLAGIIIGALGVLDDVTVSQASIVQELKTASQGLSSYDTFSKAMRVGKDHITSVVNTLVLVYAGASLPMFLLFMDNGTSFAHTVNLEFISEEIARTLVGSIGLVLSVPVATYLAVLVLRPKTIAGQPGRDQHRH